MFYYLKGQSPIEFEIKSTKVYYRFEEIRIFDGGDGG